MINSPPRTPGLGSRPGIPAQLWGTWWGRWHIYLYVVKRRIHHPPVTIFIGINHSQMDGLWHCFTHIIYIYTGIYGDVWFNGDLVGFNGIWYNYITNNLDSTIWCICIFCICSCIYIYIYGREFQNKACLGWWVEKLILLDGLKPLIRSFCIYRATP